MSALVGLSVEVERPLAVGPIGNDGLGAAISQPFAELSAVVRFITQKLLCRIGSADQPLGNRAVVRLAAGQEDGKKTAFSICKCMYFRVAPAARAANRLSLGPPFPPAAERCALMCVESIICTSVSLP
jgi:hypothetical protein